MQTKYIVNGVEVNPQTSLVEISSVYGNDAKIEIKTTYATSDFIRDVYGGMNLGDCYLSSQDLLAIILALAPKEKILAIKIVRYITGLNLRESKEFVEIIM